MSKFFEALEQAGRDRVEHGSRPEAAPAQAALPPPLADPRLPAAVPRQSERPQPADIDELLVSLLDPAGKHAEEYRGLQHVVQKMATDGQCLILGITSPVAGDGKTLTTINLAAALAQSGARRVLLIDADLRQGAVTSRLAVNRRHVAGLSDAARQGVSLDQIVTRTSWPNLDVLPAGRPAKLPYELLDSASLLPLLAEARGRYAFVVVDAPPVVPVSDCLAIEKWVDKLILIVAAHHTPRGFLDEALRALDSRKIAGIVFNRADLPPFGYSHYYYSSTPAHRSAWLRFFDRFRRDRPR